MLAVDTVRAAATADEDHTRRDKRQASVHDKNWTKTRQDATRPGGGDRRRTTDGRRDGNTPSRHVAN